MANETEAFLALARQYAETAIDHPNLKEVTLAQWILESGYGRSQLAQEHHNYGGLKWRREMEGFATPVEYQAHDGLDTYCAFADLSSFVAGYWRFLDRSPYSGWREHAADPATFIRFIGAVYTPTFGYADAVLNLVPKARSYLERHIAGHKGPGTAEAFRKPPIKAFIESPNCASRNGARIARVICHYTTASEVQGSLEWFKNPVSQRSAHYVIARNGDIYQMVRDSDKAWHAKTANADSIGIEHSAAPGERLSPAQEAASVALIRWLVSEYKLSKAAVTGHRFTAENAGSTDCPSHLFGAPTEAALRDWVDRKI